MTQNFKEEQTLVIIKPDGVKRGLIGEIIRRFEQRGLKIIAIQMISPTRKQMDDHYPKNVEWVARLGEKTLKTYEKYGLSAKEKLGTDKPEEIGKMIRTWIIDFMMSGPIVKIVVQGVHAIDMVRKICGNTLPNLADMGTLRGDYSTDSPALANADKRAVHNIVHASETPEEAEHEIKHWFTKDEIHSYHRSEHETMF